MKTILRFGGLGMLLAAFVAVGAVPASAQDVCSNTAEIEALDAKIRENYPKIETREIALNSGKEFLEKFGACADVADFVNWLKPQIPTWEKQVDEYKKYVWLKPRIERFDNGIKASKYDDTYAAGAEILAKYPDNMNIMVPLGLIGLYESYKNNFKYNDDAVRYAKTAISKLKAGAEATKKNTAGEGMYGAFQYERNKVDAISELTYGIGYINFYAKKDKKGALPYYYEVTQLPGAFKEEPRLYATIASYYVDESTPIGEEIVKLIDRQKAAPTDEEKEKLEVEIKGKVALYNGYIERALDAFGRAHKFADDKIASEKTLKAEVYKTLQTLFERRFPEKKDGLDSWISAATQKPMPNPTSEVQPVTDPEPTTTVNTTTAAPAATNGKTATTTKP